MQSLNERINSFMDNIILMNTDGDFCAIFGAISGGMEFNTGGVVGGVLLWSFEFVVTLFVMWVWIDDAYDGNAVVVAGVLIN